MTNRKRARFFLLTASAAVFVVACSSSSDHPAPAVPGATQGTGGGTSTGADASSDAEASVPLDAAGACGPITRNGGTIGELIVASAPPAPLGGSVVAGTYDLVELDTYDADAGMPSATSRSAQITIVVTTTTIARSEVRETADAGPGEAISAVSYGISGTSLATTTLCPTAGTMAAIGYSASASSLSLFADASHVEVYMRR